MSLDENRSTDELKHEYWKDPTPVNQDWLKSLALGRTTVRWTVMDQAVEMYMDLGRDLGRLSRKRLRKEMRQAKRHFNPFGDDLPGDDIYKYID